MTNSSKIKTTTLIEQIKKDLRALHLKDMAAALDETLDKARQQNQGYSEFLAGLVEIQLAAMQNRSIERRIEKANFPPRMSFDNFDFNFQTALNVPYIKDLMTLDFVVKRHPLLILGKTGCGKTHIAVSLGKLACQKGFKARFYQLQELLAMLYKTLADDSTDDFIGALGRLDILIIDHVGYIRLKSEYPSLLHDLICACQSRVSLIVTSSISLAEWGDALGNSSITHAIVDRLFDNAHVININPALSYRSQGPNAPQLASSETA